MSLSSGVSGSVASTNSPECVRCKKPIVSGHAYELGEDRWHTHCFSCYRCNKSLSCDSDFLVLGTSALICFDCSDSCKNCGKKIDDLAIILSSSNEAYCSDCFKCCKCHEPIKDLRYAKTKRGLFCLNCHEKLLAKRKLYEEEKRKKLLSTKDQDGNAPMVVPQRSVRRPLSPIRQGNMHTLSNSLDNSKALGLGHSRTRSSSKYNIKAEPDTLNQQFSKENNDKSSLNGQDEMRDESQHTRNVSIDDILDSTLEIDQMEQEESGKDHLSKDGAFGLNSTTVLQPPAKSLLNKTPLKNNSKGRIFNDDTASNNDTEATSLYTTRTPKSGDEVASTTLNSPMAVKQEYESSDDEQSRGLALSFNATNTTLPSSVKANSQPTAPNPRGVLRSQTLAGNVKQLPPQQLNNSLSPNKKLTRSFSMKSKSFVNNIKTKTANLLESPKSNNTAMPSTSSMTGLAALANSNKGDVDTHYGWGVQSEHEQLRQNRTTLTPTPQQRRINSRGQSDSTIYSGLAEKTITEPWSHKRSKSGTPTNLNNGDSVTSTPQMASNISMYRTPPLETPSSFSRMPGSSATSHYRKHSLQSTVNAVKEEDSDEDSTYKSSKRTTKVKEDGDSNETDEEFMSPNDAYISKDLMESELTLRKLKLEIREMESTKLRLTRDIEALKSHKDGLSEDVSRLQKEKEQLQLNAESLVEMRELNSIESSPMRHPQQMSTASIARAAPKPKFWKIFAKGDQLPPAQRSRHNSEAALIQPQLTQAKPGMLSSNSSLGNSIGKVEISAPILQNPNEFNDIKLVPIAGNSNSDLSSQQTSALSDVGSVLYGSSLVARCAHEKNDVPTLVRMCIAYVEQTEDRLKTEGLYRKSGSQSLIEQIEKDFATMDDEEELKRLMSEDIHAVAGVLKRYLRKLPNPVLTFQIYEVLISLVRDNGLVNELPLNAAMDACTPLYVRTIETLQNILKTLPQEHYVLLKLLASHIHTVSSYSDWNLMTLHNLTLVFTPGLIRDFSGEKDIIDMKERNYIVEFLVAHHLDIFV